MKRGRELNVPLQIAVQIVLLCDAGTGKSSLITAFISAHFLEDLSFGDSCRGESDHMNSGMDIEMKEHAKTGLAARSHRDSVSKALVDT